MKKIDRMPKLSTKMPPTDGPKTKAEEMTAFCKPKKDARSLGRSAVTSATHADEPVSAMARPAPVISRPMSSAGSADARPVPKSPTARTSMPPTISNLRPCESATCPMGTFNSNFAKLGADSSKPTELCARPNCWPYSGKIGSNAPTPTYSGNWETSNTFKFLSASAFRSSVRSRRHTRPTSCRQSRRRATREHAEGAGQALNCRYPLGRGSLRCDIPGVRLAGFRYAHERQLNTKATERANTIHLPQYLQRRTRATIGRQPQRVVSWDDPKCVDNRCLTPR
mmetsp:Transcript_24300/g.69005  ORF Transcript_24300/g.69005 Transcript_24300/m.69005 type:complete len:282 (-) Transcript_24300:8-853(-)